MTRDEKLAQSIRHYFYDESGRPRSQAERKALVDQGIAVAAANKLSAGTKKKHGVN